MKEKPDYPYRRRWEAELEKLRLVGYSRPDAVKKLRKENPGLCDAMVQEANDAIMARRR